MQHFRAAKLTCVLTCTFTHPALQTSAGQGAQALNQHKKTVLPQRRGGFIWNPAIKKGIALTLEFQHHISNVQRPPRSHVVPLWRKRPRCITDVPKILHNCPARDIPFAPPTPLSPSNFTAGTSPIESRVSCKGKEVSLCSGSASSSQCLQNIRGSL